MCAQLRLRLVLPEYSASVRGLAFTPDSQSLLSSSSDGTLRVWDAVHGQPIRSMEGCAAPPYNDVSWSPDGAHAGQRRPDAAW